MAAMMASASAGAEAPIYLVTEPAEQGIRIKVVGAPKADIDATFALEVVGSGNQSRHSGSASLRAGETVTLSTVTLGDVQPGQWRAHLRVQPQGGTAYEQVRTAP
jgi:hypothetical protein